MVEWVRMHSPWPRSHKLRQNSLGNSIWLPNFKYSFWIFFFFSGRPQSPLEKAMKKFNLPLQGMSICTLPHWPTAYFYQVFDEIWHLRCRALCSTLHVTIMGSFIKKVLGPMRWDEDNCDPRIWMGILRIWYLSVLRLTNKKKASQSSPPGGAEWDLIPYRILLVSLVFEIYN